MAADKLLTKAEYESPELLSKIGRQIITSLGRPPLLDEVRVRHVFSNAYRVNVVVRKGDQKEISDSFFIRVVMATKEIQSCSPPICKKY